MEKLALQRKFKLQQKEDKSMITLYSSHSNVGAGDVVGATLLHDSLQVPAPEPEISLPFGNSIHHVISDAQVPPPTVTLKPVKSLDRHTAWER